MENASKALLIAGAILMGMIILSIFAYMFSNMGNFSDQYSKTIESQSIEEFNSKYSVYLNRDLNIQDVITLYNLVNDNNSSNYKKIEFENKINKLKIALDNYNNNNKNIIFNDSDLEKKYKCTLEYKNDGKVSKIIIELK